MKATVDFFKGLTCQNASYPVRHSRAYSAGAVTSGALIVFVPVCVLLGLGFLAGCFFR